MVTLLSNMASTIRELDRHHLITVGSCWPSSSLLTQDCTHFLMPQFLGGDARTPFEELPETGKSFGILNVDHEPKPAAVVASAYHADRPLVELSTDRRYLDFAFENYCVHAEEYPDSDDRRVLCAAFDRVEFLDAAGKTLLILDTGTGSARSYLPKGFCAAETPEDWEVANRLK